MRRASSYSMRVRGCVSRISAATLIVYRGLSMSLNDWCCVRVARLLFMTLISFQRLQDLDDGRPEQDDPQHGKDAADHRKDHARGGLRGALLRSLTLAPSHLRGLHAQEPRDRHAHLVRLHDRLDQMVQVGHS